MTSENYVQEPQRPDLGIETVSPAAPVTVTDEHFPWLSTSEVSVATVEIQLVGIDETIRYGSVIGGCNAAERIARSVSPTASIAAERSMFRGLPMLLRRERTSTIELVPHIEALGPIYKTTGIAHNAPRLFFGMTVDEMGRPVVLKLGIAAHDKQQALLGVLRGNGRNRRKKDG